MVSGGLVAFGGWSGCWRLYEGRRKRYGVSREEERVERREARGTEEGGEGRREGGQRVKGGKREDREEGGRDDGNWAQGGALPAAGCRAAECGQRGESNRHWASETAMQR